MLYIVNRNFNMKNTCVTLGKFDGLHRGHMLLIDRAVKFSRENDLSSVLFTFDLNKKSIYSSENKKRIIEACGIDCCIVYPFDELTMNMEAQDFIKNILVEQLGVKKIIVGSDFCFGHNRKGNVAFLKENETRYGYKVDVVEKLSIDDNVVSSTYIKQMLENGCVTDVEKHLGRKYSIDGIVSKGKQLGRTIGFPTANIIPEKNILLPRLGVYSTEVVIGNTRKKGITNIGNRPTVNGDYVSIETFISDFNSDIYDQYIKVEFIEFIRPEMKFESLEALKEQINKDMATIQ